MRDRALGKTKAERAGLARNSRVDEFRKVNYGQYTNPKPSYQQYEVSEQAQDILNRQMRTYNR
jgi:hypothetical protein